MDPPKKKMIDILRKQDKEVAKILFDDFHNNLEHYFKMDKEIKDLKNDPKNLDDEEYIKNLDEKLSLQSSITQKKFCNLEISLDKCWYEKNTIKSWIKKWMSKYKDDPNYIKNMKLFIKKNEDLLERYPEIYFTTIDE